MFKNRIRTAAIAGIAALATGISGTVVATPAFAQTVQTEATIEQNLELSNEQVAADIDALAGTQAYQDAIALDADLTTEAVAGVQAEVVGILADINTNIAAAEAAVAEATALAEDLTDAQAAYVDAVRALSDVLFEEDETYTVSDVTYTNATLAAKIEALYSVAVGGEALADDAEFEAAVAYYETVSAKTDGKYTAAPFTVIQAEVDAQYDGNTVEERQAFDARKAFFTGVLNEIKAEEAGIKPAADAVDAAAEALTYVQLERRSAELTEAQEQLNAVRGLDTYLAGVRNYLVALENPLLTGDADWTTTFEVYNSALAGVGAAVDEAITAGGTDKAIDVTELVRAELVDQAAADQASADQDAADRAQAQIDALQALIDAIKAGNETPAPAPVEPAPSSSSVDADLSSGDNAGVFGIVAVIAAILAAIGLALPALNITLPF